MTVLNYKHESTDDYDRFYKEREEYIMGYYVNSMESSFMLKKENVDKAWDALKKLFDEIPRIGWASQKVINESTSFEEAMEECGWTIEQNENGDYDSIYFSDEKYGDNEIELEAIAPYIENGSYIQMRGEEGDIWRWIFKDGKCIEKYATISFE